MREKDGLHGFLEYADSCVNKYACMNVFIHIAAICMHIYLYRHIYIYVRKNYVCAYF